MKYLFDMYLDKIVDVILPHFLSLSLYLFVCLFLYFIIMSLVCAYLYFVNAFAFIRQQSEWKALKSQRWKLETESECNDLQSEKNNVRSKQNGAHPQLKYV